VQRALRDDGVLFTLRDLCRLTPATWRVRGGYDPSSCEVLPVEPRPVGVPA
jgi:hypothetical protein